MPVVHTEKASKQYYVDVLGVVLKRLGWTNVASGPHGVGTDIVWSEEPSRKPKLLALPHGCRTNRFFAMVRVCRKVCLAVLLDACERLHPEHFAGLAPSTWWVGREAIGWDGQIAAHKAHNEATGVGSAYIVKPDNGCQGAGIQLVRGHAELLALLARPDGPERAVVQTYLPDPLLVDELKFDLRLYVVLTCASPLQAFLSTRGVARFASHPWRPVDDSNLGDMMMHLSNSSINQVNTGVSNKWELPRLWARLAEGGIDVEQLWGRIHTLVALTLVGMQPAIAHAYTTAFSVGAFKPRPKPRAAAAVAAGGGGTHRGGADGGSGPLSSRASSGEQLPGLEKDNDGTAGPAAADKAAAAAEAEAVLAEAAAALAPAAAEAASADSGGIPPAESAR